MVKNLPANEGDENDPGSVLGQETPGEKRHPTPVVLPGSFRGQRPQQTAQRAGLD